MKCPNVDTWGCPSKEKMNVHTNDWWMEMYCPTCGYEGKERFEKVRPIERQALPPPAPPRRKKTTT